MDLKYIQPATWMRDSLHIIGHKTLLEITIPGTHDSAAYRFTNILMPGSQSDFVEFLIKNTGGLIDDTIKHMETTQELNVYEQLLAGARYLDIRAGWLNNEWLTYHCHVGDKLEKVLLDVKRFLDCFDCEIVIVEISHFRSKNSTPNVDELHRIIFSSLGEHMFPVRYNLDFTIGEMIESQKRAIVTVPKYFDENRGLWKSKFLKNTYPEKNKVELVRKYNKTLVKGWTERKKLLKVSWILTPDLKQFRKSLLGIALEVNKDLTMTFYQKLKKREIRFGNILIIDNFGKSEIMNIIYRMNGIIL